MAQVPLHHDIYDRFFVGLHAKEIVALTLGCVFQTDGRVRAEFFLEST
jgi:hypothetical protein